MGVGLRVATACYPWCSFGGHGGPCSDPSADLRVRSCGGRWRAPSVSGCWASWWCRRPARRRRAGSTPSSPCFRVLKMNKAGGPRVLLTSRLQSARCLSSLIWLDGRISEGSANEFHWATHAWRLLDRMVFDHAHPCFFCLTVWFQREHFEALSAINIMEHAFSFHDVGGECHGSPRSEY